MMISDKAQMVTDGRFSLAYQLLAGILSVLVVPQKLLILG